MKKTLHKRDYDTETAERIAQHNVSYFGDPAGYSETLYKTPDGYYFLHLAGGADSPYPAERIKTVSAVNAEKWLAAHPAED
jgi:hypothetical protein